MLKNIRDKILSELAEIMNKLPEQICKCEDELEEQNKIKMIAASQGDLSENMEYSAAKENIARLNTQLISLYHKKESWAEFVETKYEKANYVSIGSCVRLNIIDCTSPKFKGNIYDVVIVPELLGRADIGAIPISSPVGKNLSGKQAGDIIIVKTGNMTIEYKILELY